MNAHKPAGRDPLGPSNQPFPLQELLAASAIAPQTDCALALELAVTASALAATRFHAQDLNIDTKPDQTPVTDADLAAERLLREKLAEQRPDDGVIGEEFARRNGESTRTWVVDPIDGTKNFLRGVPVWATLVACVEDTRVVASAVSAPALGRVWWAGAGLGAWMWELGTPGPRRLSVSRVASLDAASLSFSSLSGWRDRGLREQFLALTDQVWRVRAFGDFWSYLMVAEGVCDIAAEPELNLYDMAALVPIVTEAGGRFTDLAGNAGPFGDNAVATNGLVHNAVLTALQPEL